MILTYILCYLSLILFAAFVVCLTKSFKLTEGDEYIRHNEKKALVISIINAVVTIAGIFFVASKAYIAVAAISVAIAIFMFISFKTSYKKDGTRKYHKEPEPEEIVY